MSNEEAIQKDDPLYRFHVRDVLGKQNCRERHQTNACWRQGWSEGTEYRRDEGTLQGDGNVFTLTVVVVV